MSSGFRDSFTKSDSKSSALDYDDGAFWFFAATGLGCIVVPWTIGIIHSICFKRTPRQILEKNARKHAMKIRDCKCHLCKENQADGRSSGADAKGSLKFAGFKFAGLSLSRLILLFLWVILAYICVFRLDEMSSAGSFDPFGILGITEDADERVIKKAFRTKSLKYHPDKNKNDATAAAKFMMISKAYQALTDPVAKQNFLKYGNPDGIGMMKVGIGLPKFLVDQTSQIFIFAVFSIILLIALPSAFIFYFHRLREYERGLHKSTYQLCGGFMSPMTQPAMILSLVASSHECRSVPYRESDEAVLAKVRAEVPQPPEELLFDNAAMRKAVTLLCCHSARRSDLLTPALKGDLAQILKHAINVSRAMVDIAFVNNWIPTIQSVLGVRKMLAQGLSGMVPMQVPHVTPEQAAQIMKLLQTKPGANEPPKPFPEIMDITIAEKDTYYPGFTEQQIETVKEFAAVLPRVKLEATVEVEGESEIAVGDVAKCVIKFTREHLKEDEIQGYIHAPYFPAKRCEEWFFFVTDAATNRLYGTETSRSLRREVEVTVQFRVDGKPGRQEIDVVALCDSYFGVDKTVSAEYTVLDPATLQRQDLIHPEDIALDMAPSFLENVIGSLKDPSQVDDDEDEDEEDGEGEGEGKAQGATQGAGSSGSGSGSGSEATSEAADGRKQAPGAETRAAQRGRKGAAKGAAAAAGAGAGAGPTQTSEDIDAELDAAIEAAKQRAQGKNRAAAGGAKGKKNENAI